MEKLPISADNARQMIADAIRRGPVHMFSDEADETAKLVVRAILSHWPHVFREKKARGKGKAGKAAAEAA